MPYRIRINYDKFSFDSTLFSVFFWSRNKWQRNWKAKNCRRSWPTTAFMTCVRTNSVYSLDRRSVFSISIHVSVDFVWHNFDRFKWNVATIELVIEKCIKSKWDEGHQIKSDDWIILSDITTEVQWSPPVIWFGLIVGPTVPVKVSGCVKKSPAKNALTFKQTKRNISFYDSTTTCERYVIGSWI